MDPVVQVVVGGGGIAVWTAIAATCGAAGSIIASIVALWLAGKAGRRQEAARLAAAEARARLVLVEAYAEEVNTQHWLRVRVKVTN